MDSTSTVGTPPFEVEVYYDGDCPLCLREIEMLKRLDRRAAIRFTNIAAPEFDARATGLDAATLMKRIHGRLPNGELIEGVEVFRRLYGAVGFRRLVSLSRAPGVSGLLDVAYNVFAKNRLKLTGRCEAGVCAAPSRLDTVP
jgi:predicted DCC family thiol-disulfide oxidoreductase YuxK